MWSTLADDTSARCTSTSHTGGERMENQSEWQAWWSQISASGAVRHMPVLRQHRNTWQQQKDATDAWLILVGFNVPSSTFLLTPSAHGVISSLTTPQNSSAILLLWIIRLPRSFICDQCRNLCRCLWKRSLAKDQRQMESKTVRKGEENTSNRNLEGRRMRGARARGRRDLPRAPTRVRTRSYRTPSL